MSQEHNGRIITPQEAEIVLGRSNRQTRRLLARIRRNCNKTRWQPIIAREFCDFFHLTIDEIKDILKWN